MSQNRTIESVEAEAARVRMQLVVAGADIRSHADPTVIVDAAKASFARRSKEAPRFLRENASPIVLVLLGGALGATLTGLIAPSRKSRESQSEKLETGAAANGNPRPSMKVQVEAALLSAVSVGIGYAGGMFIPKTRTEEKFLTEPKAVFNARLDEFLKQHVHGMKMAAANLFGASRLSAATLIGLAAAAEALGIFEQSSEPNAR